MSKYDELKERHDDALRIMLRVSAELAALRAAARAVMEDIWDNPGGLEKVASWKGSHVRILVSTEPLAALAALLLEAEGGQA